tara:strand:- start:1059 stop:1664 length:606 start_codon:yes stop_codon:yes gene_type:complete
MKIKKILIYGSSNLTQKVCDFLRDKYDLVGHVPSMNPTVSGKIDLPIVDETINHDIKLSIQYDRKVINTENSFNIHTGLLPNWGGVDILYHTIKNRFESFIFEQGLTFHKMTRKFDYGPIISKLSYPVNDKDTMESLYNKIECCIPAFAFSSLKILEQMNEKEISQCYSEKPRIFKRGEIDSDDKKIYSDTLIKLKRKENE